MSRQVSRTTLSALLLLLALASACSRSGGGEHPKGGAPTSEHPKAEHPKPAAPPEAAPAAAAASPARAVAIISAVGGSGVAGTVTFTQEEGGLRVEAALTGLTPGLHGFHVHEWGDCSAPDASSAGGHYNPAGHDHAGPDAPMAHAGDLGNIEAGPDGSAHLVAVTTRLSIGAGVADVLGRGVIVHADVDDLASQPTGNAGGRVGCGVVMADAGGTPPVLQPAPVAVP